MLTFSLFSQVLVIIFENLKIVISNLLKSLEYVLMGLTMFSWPALIKISISTTKHHHEHFLGKK